MKPPSRRLWKAVATALVLVIACALIVRVWIAPLLIVRAIEARTGGKAEIRGWWLNWTSAGVTGLRLRAGTAAGSPVWAEAETVETDLTLGRLLRCDLAPRRVRLRAPRVTIGFDAGGGLLTRVGSGRVGGATGPIPVVIADGATVTVRQEGRPELVVGGVTARLGPDGDRVSLAIRSNRREWGPFEALGLFDPGFRTGHVTVKTLDAVEVTPEKVRAIPFVPPEVWASVAPTGPVDVRLTADLDREKTPAVHVRTEIDLRGTTVTSSTLDLTATRTTGRVVVDGAVVRLEKVTGTAIDGRVTADGTLDFVANPPRFDLNLDLEHLNVAVAPRSWQLDEAGVTGYLTGKAHLLARLGPDGPDLTGSSGVAEVEKGLIQGIPFKSLRLQMTAEGNDLRYDTGRARSSRAVAPVPAWAAAQAAALVALQVTPGVGGTRPAAPEPKKSGVRLPRSITTHIELEDVDIAQIVARAEFLLGYPFPVPVSGRLSLKADATIPLGQLRSLRDYAFHGDLTLTRASAYKVDLGRVSARVDLEDGLLELKDLRGRLVDRPDGGPDNPPGNEAATAAVPATGPLPAGAFRGTLRARIAPAGSLSAHFEGVDLPMGELAAPALPRPTPLSGLATLAIDASADLGAARDPAAWTLTGTARSRQIRYRGAELDAVATRFALRSGRLEVPELTARLRDRPLAARGGLELKPPRAFRGAVDVTGWDLAEVLAWIPGAPRPAPVAGTVTARADAQGTFQPLSIRTEGRGRLDEFRAGPVGLGAVPFDWTTKGDTMVLNVTDAYPFGGRLTATADVPLTPGRPITGSADVEAIDAAQLSAAIPGGGLRLTGRAGARIAFSIPADASALDASVNLSAPDLTVQGLPAEKARATVRAHKGVIGYELTADSLGGKVSLKGTIPLRRTSDAGGTAAVTEGEIRAVGFGLDPLWESLGLAGLAARLSGVGAVDANIRLLAGGRNPGLYTHGLVEFRGLHWGPKVPLGRLQGVLASGPSVWRVDSIRGELLGGAAGGYLWGDTAAAPAGPARRFGVDLRVERAPLRRVLELFPVTVPGVDGLATLRLAGTVGGSGRAGVEVVVDRARVAGLPLSEVRLPAELVTTDARGAGVLSVRRGTARLAGGHAQGDASFRFGADRTFQVDLGLAGVDLETIARVESEARRPATGRLNGRVTLHGSDPAQPRGYRGRVVLDLDDASLVALPVFRELDRFLGSARGGLFEDGDLTGTIANRQILVEQLTLEGRLAQLHATGTIGFDGQVNLEVLVNTNQIIPQTGQALANLIPGLNGVVGRDREATLRVANFLSNRLLKLRVTGTLRNPSVAADPGIVVAGAAVGFFTGVLKLPLGLVK